MRVKGPMGAMIATLYTNGWDPQTPTCWLDPKGKQHKLNYDEEESLEEVKEKSADQLHNRKWEGASEHYNGAGLQEGADLTAVIAHRKECRQEGRYEDAALLEK